MKNTGMYNLVLIAVFIAVIYFLMIRPQRKRDKEVKEMRDALAPGDEIITIGGIVGKITKVKEDTVTISAGADKVKMDFVKSAIAQVTNRGPQHGAAAQDNKAKESQPMAEVEDDSPKPDRNKKIRPKKIGGKDADAAKEPSDTREQ